MVLMSTGNVSKVVYLLANVDLAHKDSRVGKRVLNEMFEFIIKRVYTVCAPLTLFHSTLSESR